VEGSPIVSERKKGTVMSTIETRARAERIMAISGRVAVSEDKVRAKQSLSSCALVKEGRGERSSDKLSKGSISTFSI